MANKYPHWYPYKTRPKLAFHLPKSSCKIKLLQFADNSFLKIPQHVSLMKVVERWIQWADMRAKVSKCHSVAIDAPTGKPIDPHLKLDNKDIPFLGQDSIKFLGLPISIPRNKKEYKENLMSLLKRMLKIIDDTVDISESEGGFQIPSLITLYQRLQVCHCVQLLTSPDSCVHNIPEAKLRKEDTAIRMKFTDLQVRNSLCGTHLFTGNN